MGVSSGRIARRSSLQDLPLDISPFARRESSLISNLRNYRVAILGPGGLVQNFTQDRTQLLRALDQVSESLPNSATSRLMSAGYDLMQQLKKIPGRKSMVIFTDFHANGQDAGSLLFPGSADSLPEDAFDAPDNSSPRRLMPMSHCTRSTLVRGSGDSVWRCHDDHRRDEPGWVLEASQSVTSQISAQNSGLA